MTGCVSLVYSTKNLHSSRLRVPGGAVPQCTWYRRAASHQRLVGQGDLEDGRADRQHVLPGTTDTQRQPDGMFSYWYRRRCARLHRIIRPAGPAVTAEPDLQILATGYYITDRHNNEYSVTAQPGLHSNRHPPHPNQDRRKMRIPRFCDTDVNYWSLPPSAFT